MTPWQHVPLQEVIQDTGVRLERKGQDQNGNPKFEGAHTTRHASRSGKSLLVIPAAGFWKCLSCEEKGNVVDWLVDAGNVAEIAIENRAEAISYLLGRYGPGPYDWLAPLPFDQRFGPPYPVHALPAVLGDYARQVAESLQAPVDMSAATALGVASAACAGSASVQHSPDWTEPLNTFVCIVKGSGERGSPVFREVTAPLEFVQRERLERAKEQISEVNLDKDLMTDKLRRLRTDIASGKAESDSEYRSLTQELESLEQPSLPRLICDDTTTEKLVEFLADNRGVMAQFSTEGGVFQILGGLYRGGEPALDVHLKAYSGDPIYYDRKRGDSVYVPKPLLTVVVMIQPDVVRSLGDKAAFRGRGLLARFFFLVPASMVGYRKTNPLPIDAAVRLMFRTAIEQLLNQQKETDEDPRIIHLSTEAKVTFDNWRSDIEIRLRPGSALRDFSDWYLKFPGAVLRIAGIIHCLDHHLGTPHDAAISLGTMLNAIELGEYYAEHCQIAFDMMGMSGTTAKAEELWNAIVRLRKEGRLSLIFSQRDLHQLVRGNFKKAQELAETLEDLADRNYLRRIEIESTGRGRRPSPRWETNPLAVDDRTEDEPDGVKIFVNSEEYIEEGDTGSKQGDHATGDDIENSVNSVQGIGVYESSPSSESPTDQDKDYVEPSESPQITQIAGNCQEPHPEVISLGTQGEINIAQNSPNSDIGIEYVTDNVKAETIINSLLELDVVGFDVETTGLDPITDKVRLVQMATPDSTFVFDINSVRLDLLVPLLESASTIKIAHNAKFDCSFIYESTGVMPEPVFDTMLADQVLRHSAFPRSLKDLAADYLDFEIDKEQQASNWQSERLTNEQIEYAAADATVLLELHGTLISKIEEIRLLKIMELENRVIPAVVWMERCGVGFDVEHWRGLLAESQTKTDEIRVKLNVLAARELGGIEINWNSNPQILRVLNTLGIHIDNTRHETIEQVQVSHEIVPLLMAYREGRKKVSTYGDKWLRFVHSVTERIHADWKPIGAETGRMSCSKPNLQNLPRGPAYRQSFVPSPGNVIIKSDYSQIELRIAAQMSGDTRMIDAFKEGLDLHKLTASVITGQRNIEEVTEEQRQMAKAVNFGLVYGMGARRLAEYAKSSFGVDMDEKTATAIRTNYFKTYPGIRAWHRAQGRKTETRTTFGRYRKFERDRYFNRKLESPVSGAGADGLKVALANLWETRNQVAGAFPVAAVHDEIVIEAPAEQVQEAKAWVEECMLAGMADILTDVPCVVESDIKETW